MLFEWGTINMRGFGNRLFQEHANKRVANWADVHRRQTHNLPDVSQHGIKRQWTSNRIPLKCLCDSGTVKCVSTDVGFCIFKSLVISAPLKKGQAKICYRLLVSSDKKLLIYSEASDSVVSIQCHCTVTSLTKMNSFTTFHYTYTQKNITLKPIIQFKTQIKSCPENVDRSPK